MEFNFHNCGVGDARLQRLVEEGLGQSARAASDAAGMEALSVADADRYRAPNYHQMNSR